jgi:hypothetical protein
MIFLVTLCTHYSYAANKIYTQSVFVKNQSSDDFSVLVESAMEKELFKLTGNPEVLNNPDIRLALPHALHYSNSFHYSRSTSDQKSLIVEFKPESVDQLLYKAMFPVWNGKREEILMWVAIKNTRGIDMLPAIYYQSIQNKLEKSARKYGLTLYFPDNDLETIQNVSATEIFNEDIHLLQLASTRYHNKIILMGKIDLTETPIQSHWQLFTPTTVNQWGYTTLLDNLFDEVFTNTLKILAKQYGVIKDKMHQSLASLSFTPIHSMNDYNKVFDDLKKTNLVTNIVVDTMKNSQLKISAKVYGNAIKLIKTLEDNGYIVTKPYNENHLNFSFKRLSSI